MQVDVVMIHVPPTAVIACSNTLLSTYLSNSTGMVAKFNGVPLICAENNMIKKTDINSTVIIIIHVASIHNVLLQAINRVGQEY